MSRRTLPCKYKLYGTKEHDETNCEFAHSRDQLEPFPVTELFKNRSCKFKEKCSYGLHCKYRHDGEHIELVNGERVITGVFYEHLYKRRIYKGEGRDEWWCEFISGPFTEEEDEKNVPNKELESVTTLIAIQRQLPGTIYGEFPRYPVLFMYNQQSKTFVRCIANDGIVVVKDMMSKEVGEQFLCED